MSKIEVFLFEESQLAGDAPLISKLSFRDEVVTMAVVRASDEHGVATLTFPDAKMIGFWLDEEDAMDWPLDIIGFDSVQQGDEWRFVLNCSSIELIWKSKWPSRLTE